MTSTRKPSPGPRTTEPLGFLRNNLTGDLAGRMIAELWACPRRHVNGCGPAFRSGEGLEPGAEPRTLSPQLLPQ